MPCDGALFDVASERSLLQSSFVNVDLPEDLGPQIMMIRLLSAGSDSLERSRFHSGGDTRGWR